MVEVVDPESAGRVSRGAIGILQEEPVGEPACLTEIQIVEPVAVGVADRQAVALEVTHAVRPPDAREPVVQAVRDVRLERRIISQHLPGAVREPRPAGSVRLLEL